MSLLLRLAVGRGRAAAARLVLVALGTALATPLLLLAVGIAGIDRRDLASCFSPETGTVDCPGQVSNPYLEQPGLRRGVVLGFVLCVVPLLVFVATAARVAARRRDERLAGLRLAGATDGQVRALAALDTGVGTLAGVVVGGVAYVVGRTVVVRTASGQLRAIAEATAPAPLAALLALAVVVLILVGSASLALQAVRITPLGVVRRAPRRVPRPSGLLLLIGGLAGLGVVALVGGPRGPETLLLGGLVAVTMLGLVTCGPWLTSLTGRVVAGRANGPAALLAGRRLEDDPRAQARATSALVLVVLAATIGLVAYADAQATIDPIDVGFSRQGYGLAGLGAVFSLLVAAAGLLLATLEGLLERRRTLGALHAAGVPLSVLRRAVLLQAGLPVLPAAVLAMVTGLAVTTGLLPRGLPPPAVLLLPAAAVLVAVLAAACTLPALPAAADLEQLRTA